MSRIALGAMRIENMSSHDFEHLLEECLSLGINYLDLADIYGNTKCESIAGEVFDRRPDLRKRIYLQTKVGISFSTRGYDSSYDYLIDKTKESLKRLHTDYLDCLLIHRPDVLMDAEEVARAVRYLMDHNLIYDFGVSNFTRSEIEYLEEYLGSSIKYDQVNLGLGNTTMIDQTMYCNIPSYKVSKESDDLFFYLKRHHIAIQCWSPYQYGFFEGSIFNRDRFPQISDTLSKYAWKYQTSPCAIATAWLLKLDKNLIVVTGSLDISHIKESLDGEKIELSKEDWYRIYEESGHMLP